MTPPDWRMNPKWQLWGCLACAVAAAGWQLGSWSAGTWVPGWADLVRFSVGLLLGYAFVLPEYVQYNRIGDEYVRGLLQKQFEFGSAFRRSGWILLGRLLWWGIYLAAVNLRGLYPSAVVGVFLGMAVWNGFMIQLWKRMWELYETEGLPAATMGEG